MNTYPDVIGNTGARDLFVTCGDVVYPIPDQGEVAVNSVT